MPKLAKYSPLVRRQARPAFLDKPTGSSCIALQKFTLGSMSHHTLNQNLAIIDHTAYPGYDFIRSAVGCLTRGSGAIQLL